MEKSTSFKENLQIFLITCNRSASLDNTLRQLSESPFRHCRFTVLDNCSTDDTPEIAARYQQRFNNYHIIRHNRNIGGDNNYLRAVELSTALYTWVLCDDDNYDFSHVDDIITALETCRYDFIYVASRQVQYMNWTGYGPATVHQLINDGATYHRGCTFWPALIFKTNLFDNHCYHNAPRIFPSFLFINKSINDNFSIYVAKHEVIIRSVDNISEISPLYLYTEWVANASKLKDHRLRERIIEQCTCQGFIKTLGFWIALEKTNHAEGYWKRLVDIFFALSPRQRMKFILLLPVMIIPVPKPLLIRARELVYRLLGQADVTKLPPLERKDR